MRTVVYNSPIRDFANFANAVNRAFGPTFGNYDFARNGGHTNSGHANSGHSNGKSESKMKLPVDIWSENDTFIVTAYVPGVDPEAVEITMEGEELIIQGTFPALPHASETPVAAGEEAAENSEEKNEETATDVAANDGAANNAPQFIKRELFRGAFERRMTINVPIDIDNIEATYTNGLLTLRLPKAEAVRPKQIKVVTK